MKTRLRCYAFFLAALFSSTHLSAQIPPKPYLSSPTNGATDVSLTPTLTWTTLIQHSSFKLEIWKGGSPLYEFDVGGYSYTLDYGKLENGVTYSWRVRSYNQWTYSNWTDFWQFTVASLGMPQLISPPDEATGVSLTPTLSWTETVGAHHYVLFYNIMA